jgi:(S)-mandelate dehydrogenase
VSARLKKTYDYNDVRELARKRLPKGLFEYIDRGTNDEVAISHLRSAFDRIKFRPHTLTDVSEITLTTELFGQRVAMPVAIAPTGSAGLVWFEGELELARAAANAGIPFILATRATSSIEAVAERARGIHWLQLYVWRDREMSYRLIDRARAAGFEALVVTVDTPVSPNREYNRRNGYGLPFKTTPVALWDILCHPAWFVRVIAKYLLTTGLPRFENIEGRPKITESSDSSATRSDSLNWDDIKELRRRWPHKLIIKGILRSDDAQQAVEYGADGVIVSSHGGRNLDSAISPMLVLPEIVDAIGGRSSVLLDSGVRRGSDVIKALALGASGVLIGRPTLFGTAIGGRIGAEHVLSLLKNEISGTMGMLGCTTIDQINRDILVV